MTTKINKLNKYILSFIENTDVAHFNREWMKPEVQKFVTSIISLKSKSHFDKYAPKRSKSSYLFFCSEMRDVVKDSLAPEHKTTDVTRELGVQ